MNKELLNYYKELGISLETLELVNNPLKLPDVNLTPFARERRTEAFKEAIPYMGETKEQCRDYILDMLASLTSCSVAWLGDYPMDYRQEQRSLFALTRCRSETRYGETCRR